MSLFCLLCWLQSVYLILFTYCTLWNPLLSACKNVNVNYLSQCLTRTTSIIPFPFLMGSLNALTEHIWFLYFVYYVTFCLFFCSLKFVKPLFYLMKLELWGLFNVFFYSFFYLAYETDHVSHFDNSMSLCFLHRPITLKEKNNPLNMNQSNRIQSFILF